MSDQLKLMALDSEDLTVLSAHVQDAVAKSGEIEFLPKDGKFSLPLRRFAWEAKGARRFFFKRYERRLAVLSFDRVRSLQTHGVSQNDPDQVLSLLSVEFSNSTSANAPSGNIILTFSEGRKLRLNVECIEAKLTDVGGAWAAPSRPQHDRPAD